MGLGRASYPSFCRSCSVWLMADEGDYCQVCYGELPRAQQMADDDVLVGLLWVEGLPPDTALREIG